MRSRFSGSRSSVKRLSVVNSKKVNIQFEDIGQSRIVVTLKNDFYNREFCTELLETYSARRIDIPPVATLGRRPFRGVKYTFIAEKRIYPQLLSLA
jgi:hypothetical protein